MSLLLKALEKSEEEKNEGAAASPVAAAQSSPAAAGGGFKLAGGAGQGSKLGSALASRPDSQDAGTAGRVVAAYEHEKQAGEEHDLVAASRKQTIKRFAGIGILAVVGFAGYYAYLELGVTLGSQQASTEELEVSQSGEVQTPARDDGAKLLPLPEPIYDIQESILIASLDSSVSSTADAEENIAQQVTDVVATIIEERLEQQRRRNQLSEVGLDQQETVANEIEGLLSKEFNPETAKNISTLDQMAMLDQLKSLSKVYESRNFTVKPASFVAAMEDKGAKASEMLEKPAVAAPQKKITLTASKDKTKDLIDQGALNYRYGNLDEAEKAFRTVIAVQPTNVSALLGLAKVHQSRGNKKLALSTLLKAAEYSPNDPNIVGELISIQAENASTEVIEQRILSLIGKSNSPAIRAKLLFALGNAHARDRSWIDARNAYKAAYELNKTNSDYIFNLAVISDYMQDKTGALSYYRDAIDAARGSPSSFDHSAARKRIKELEEIL